MRFALWGTLKRRPMPGQQLIAPLSSRWVTIAGWLFALWFVYDGLNRHTPSNDEWVQHHYGQLLWRFYTSGLTDTSFLTFSNLRLYGGFFDLIAAAGTDFLSWPWWPWRHLLTALFGLLALLGTVRLSRWVAGRKPGLEPLGRAAATWAFLLLLLTGPFWGAIFTHTKDIPFAAAMVWGLYYTGRLTEHPERFKTRHLLLWGVATGIALGLRAAGLLLVFFLGAALTWRSWQEAKKQAPVALALRQTLGALVCQSVALLPAFAIAAAIMAFSWPWAVMGWANIPDALRRFSHFTFAMYTWEEGERLLIDRISNWYLLRYLLIRLPEVVWLGIGAWLVLARLRDLQRVGVVVAAVLFVLTYVTFTHPALYNGIRHFLFIVPWVIALSALGLARLVQKASEPGQHMAQLVLVVALVSAGQTAVTLARLHPYEHVYYNVMSGGLPRADTSWETDYWSDATRALVPAITAWMRDHPQQQVVHLAYCAERFQIEPWLPEGVVITSDWFDADLFLSTTHDDCHQALDGPEIARIERLGVALAVLKSVGHLNRPPPPLP